MRVVGVQLHSDSSIVMMRSVDGTRDSRAARSVVLPAPVAPAMRMFSRRSTRRSSLSRWRAENIPARWRACRSGRANAGTRTEILVPLAATGASTACTRTPRSSRTSTQGVASSRCRPPSAMRRTARRRTSVSDARHEGTCSMPSPRSTKSPRSPLTKRSVTRGSSRNGRRNATAGSGASTVAGSRPLQGGAREVTTTTVGSCRIDPRARRSDQWIRREDPHLWRSERRERRSQSSSGRNSAGKRRGRHPYSGGRGMPPRAGEKLGGSPDASAGSDVRALARVRVQVSPANSTRPIHCDISPVSHRRRSHLSEVAGVGGGR